MTSTSEIEVITELTGRRDRLHEARQNDATGPDVEVQGLIADLDAALDRLEHGTFGICEVCHEDIGIARITSDPLARCCVEHPTTDELARVQRDLRLARTVQLGLLPRATCRVTGWEYRYKYEPASEVGGDFCDVISIPSRPVARDARHDEDATLVLVGDVSGKGVAASMLMSSLLATFRSLASIGLPPREILARANAVFHDLAPGPSYATLGAAVLLPGGAVDLYSAGHWPPILRHEGLTIPLTVAAGLPLGLFPDSTYAPTRIRLGQGDTLLFFTDGVVEAENSRGDDYSLARLGDALAAAERDPLETVVDRCLRDVRAFQDRARVDDDVLLFAVRGEREMNANEASLPH